MVLCTDSGRVYAWGRGEFGQLGVGLECNETEPQLVEALSREGRVHALAAGENHSLAVMGSSASFCAYPRSVYQSEDGSLFSFGFGQQGQVC